MIIKQSEIDQIKNWCQKTRDEEGRTYIIRQNPFQNEFAWAKNLIFIEIDKPKVYCGKKNLVYDSTSGALYRFLDARWMEVIPTQA